MKLMVDILDRLNQKIFIFLSLKDKLKNIFKKCNCENLIYNKLFFKVFTIIFLLKWIFLCNEYRFHNLNMFLNRWICRMKNLDFIRKMIFLVISIIMFSETWNHEILLFQIIFWIEIIKGKFIFENRRIFENHVLFDQTIFYLIFLLSLNSY